MDVTFVLPVTGSVPVKFSVRRLQHFFPGCEIFLDNWQEAEGDVIFNVGQDILLNPEDIDFGIMAAMDWDGFVKPVSQLVEVEPPQSNYVIDEDLIDLILIAEDLEDPQQSRIIAPGEPWAIHRDYLKDVYPYSYPVQGLSGTAYHFTYTS